MPLFLKASEFLAAHFSQKAGPLLDVRSPAEYQAGHISGALSFPLFTNEERAAVGTAHAKSGSEAALHLGLELVGPNLATMLAKARALLRPNTRLLMHCWRGGMRSKSVAWLLETGGFEVTVLEGGYKAYRNYIRQNFARSDAQICVIAGLTGSGKTDILNAMAEQGAQILDLEKLANHRGSAFGNMGAQPANEILENALYAIWQGFDFSRPIFLEDEGRRIGSCTLPDTIFARIESSPAILLHSPTAERVERLCSLYAQTNSANFAHLASCLHKIESKLGGLLTKQALAALEQDDFHQAVSLVLPYYDKTYSYQLEKYTRPVAMELDTTGLSAKQTAARILEYNKVF